MRILITGITGFVGSHLAEHLLGQDYEVWGIARWRSRRENIVDIEEKIQLREADIGDAHSIKKLIDEIEPDQIYHLAAQSYVPVSWVSPAETFEVNTIGTINIFEAVRDSKCDPVIQIAGSSEEYGLVNPDEVPITEDNPLRPLSPYGVSKVACDLAGYQYNKSYGLKIIRTRAFNHTGPRRGDVFVCSNFAKQIVQIEKGDKDPEILVGNLNAYRDFTDVRDIVKAYHLAVTKCTPGEVYNICSGKTIQIQQVLDMLLSMSTEKIEVKQDPDRMRPSDVEILQGDYSKFNKQTGWKPTIPFEKTLEDTLNYWREQL